MKASWTLLLLSAFLLLTGVVVGDLGFLKNQTTYGNMDVSSQRSVLTTLSPGVPDYAHFKEYAFIGKIHLLPLFIVATVFLIFLFLRIWKNSELGSGSKRWLVQWTVFILTRMGVLRASGIYPIGRCSFGVFPFLNCHACEMATGACPIGGMQLFLSGLRFPFLVLGLFILVAVSLGRWVCGWLCPTGFFLDILGRVSLHRLKIPDKFRRVKFWILGALLVLSVWAGIAGLGAWAPFCSTFCPSGIFFGLIPYYGTTAFPAFLDALLHPFSNLSGFGWIMFHLAVLAGFLFLTIASTGRFFCRTLCPAGAFLGLFNRFSFIRVLHKADLCVHCGKCRAVCGMGVNAADGRPGAESECIRCGKCIKNCPVQAKIWR